ncbi:Threonine dehydrogenase [Micromonospora echinaurantiaca]|uniref:Threonine dehydrogenase n=1 Tax=Micromonospora echinaurantiaca TaxID=47857 RepID=A0A1C5I4M1_9ACTN|nr:glutathione-independent formaldehyde dehydrogenase [Micromonospora echinaurantiaca]SCG53208.1 Threonine dehydrogenase [Micromonospora echinaurantiaca]
MKAVVYDGPRTVSVKEVPDARIERPTDALVRITTTNICGSDLHMYDGRTDLQPGTVLGHENMGEVVEVGEGVDVVKVGDMVCLPFNVSCGVCANCNQGLTAFCLVANPAPGMAGAAYGYADMGPYAGGQAELLRVPWADFNCLVLPPDARDMSRQRDYVMLSDIFPTGWHATELACVQPGDNVAVYGAGPVGLLAAYSAIIKGANKVMVVDRHPDRLRLAEQIGAIPIDDSKMSPVDQILEQTGGMGADRGCEAVGHQAHDPSGQEKSALTLNNLVHSVRFGGTIGVVGVYFPKDPGSPDPLQKQGKAPFDYGMFWFKGQSMGTGQCNVKNYNRQLMNLIANHKAEPSFLVSHELKLDQAPEGYRNFDARNDGWTKVLLHPDGGR